MPVSNEAPAGGLSAGGAPCEPLAQVQGHNGAAEGWQASLALAFDRRGGRTVLARARHQGPLRVQRPFYPEANGTCHVYVLHPPGGVASGDVLEIGASLEPDAHALLTTPGAAKLYRSRGLEARIVQRVSLAERARLEWLPQETIVFDGAEAAVETQIELAEGAVYAGWEIVCLGRPACGERLTRGRFRSALSLSRGGRLRFAERGDYVARDPVLSEPWGLGGAPVFGLFLIADERADEGWVERVRAAVRESATFSVTLVSGVVLGRYLGPSTLDARANFESMFGALRPLYAGCEPITPRIWRT